MSERTRAMTTRHTAAFLTMALVTTMTAVGASAQTPPTPPVPVPVVKPVLSPLQVPVPVIPPLPPMPDLPILIDQALLRVDIDATVRNAMDRARLALDEVRLDRLDFEWAGQTPVVNMSRRSGESAYSAGKDLLSAGKYDEAIAQFDRVVAQKGA